MGSIFVGILNTAVGDGGRRSGDRPRPDLSRFAPLPATQREPRRVSAPRTASTARGRVEALTLSLPRCATNRGEALAAARSGAAEPAGRGRLGDVGFLQAALEGIDLPYKQHTES